MNVIATRVLAAQVLMAVLHDGAYLDGTLCQLTPSVYPSRDAALVQELCYGTLRFQPRLEYWLTCLLEQPLKPRDLDIHALLLLGLYQLAETRVPPHAAVKETAQAARLLGKSWAVNLVNAVLRRFQRESARLQTDMTQHEAALYAHPTWFIERTRASWPDDWQAILEANNSRPPLTLRANRRISTRDTLISEFAAAGIAAQACKFSADGLVLTTPMKVETLPGFTAGKFSVQDEAAQLAAELLDVRSGMRVLDACAAPGGKTCHLLERYPELSELLALDHDSLRTEKICDNLQRLGLAASVKTADAACPETWWNHRPFERILLDAPCSATGVIRRHPDIKARRLPRHVVAAAAQQARLLAALWPLLACGGKLLYATCSVLSEENVLQIRNFLAMHPDARSLEVSGDWGVETTPGRQILSGASGMDGFYYACLEKN